jgi:hypothetical protein
MPQSFDFLLFIGGQLPVKADTPLDSGESAMVQGIESSLSCG